ncbi:MAG: Spy/CpxP family protein refolding chaperone [Vibrionaceae bacterium]
MNFAKTIVATAIALPLVFASAAFAADNKGANLQGQAIQQILEGVDLTAEQKAKIEEIGKKRQDAKVDKETRAQNRVAHKKLMNEFITAEKFDEAKLREAITKRDTEKMNRFVEYMRDQNAIYNSLTADQKKQVQANLANMSEEAKGKMQRLKERLLERSEG